MRSDMGRRDGEGLLRADGRAMSTVVGAALLLGILVLLAVISGGVIFGITEKPEPAPAVVLELEEGEYAPVHLLRHESGDEIGGTGRTELRGVADPETLHDAELTAGQDREVISVVPTAEEIELVWYGEDDTSYVIWRGEPSSHLEATPEEDCEWVENETDDGTDPITVDGVVVTCDIITEGNVDLVNDAVIVGNTSSTENDVDLDESTVYGPVVGAGNVDVDGTNVSGPVTSRGSDITVTDGSDIDGGVEIGDGGNVNVDGGSSVEGRIDAGNDVSLTAVTVGSDVTSDSGDVVVANTTISGGVKSGGTVDLDNVTITGHVYVAAGNFSCSGSSINGQDCGAYTPRDPDDY